MPVILAEAGRLTDEFAGQPVAEAIRRAQEHHNRSLTVAVTGRPGSGRDCLARALRQRFGLAALGPGDEDAGQADLRVHQLAGGLHPADVEAWRTADRQRTVVVLGKADTAPDWAAATAAAEAAGAELGCPVWPVSGLLAAADLRDDELAVLRGLVAAGVTELPSMTAQFVAERWVAEAPERRRRTALLRRLDRFGLQLCLELIAEDHPASTSAADLNRLLHACSGIEALGGPLRELLPAVRARRAAELRGRLEQLAATGAGRDRIEWLLREPGDG